MIRLQIVWQLSAMDRHLVHTWEDANVVACWSSGSGRVAFNKNICSRISSTSLWMAGSLGESLGRATSIVNFVMAKALNFGLFTIRDPYRVGPALSILVIVYHRPSFGLPLVIFPNGELVSVSEYMRFVFKKSVLIFILLALSSHINDVYCIQTLNRMVSCVCFLITLSLRQTDDIHICSHGCVASVEWIRPSDQVSSIHIYHNKFEQLCKPQKNGNGRPQSGSRASSRHRSSRGRCDS